MATPPSPGLWTTDRMDSPLLEVLDLRKQYGSFPALDGVSFQVHHGEVFGLLGPNGAGKTTLLSILSGLSQPTSGEVRILGQRVLPSDRNLRQHVGIVPQELALYEQLTARENLQFFGELFGVAGKELDRRVDSLLVAVGLDSRGGHYVATFSGGMKRRLNLACALVHEPGLLLLDEPTVGVDPQSRNLIFEEVRRLRAKGMTVVYTSHYMEEVEALCSRIAIIDHGQIQAIDTLAELLRMLRGMVSCRVSPLTAELLARMAGLPGCTVEQTGPDSVELECEDVKQCLVRLVAMLNELGVGLHHLETREPNLERVFLHLTGRALRD